MGPLTCRSVLTELKQRGGCTGGALWAGTWGNSFHGWAFKFFSVWHDIKARWPPGGHRRAAGGGKQEGRRVKSGAKCVWETGVIHTLLIPTQLRSAQSLGHLAERGALCGTLSSVCEWKFQKKKKKERPPVNQQPYISFASVWLIRVFSRSFSCSFVLCGEKTRDRPLATKQSFAFSPFDSFSFRAAASIRKLLTFCDVSPSTPVTLSGPVRR